MNRRGFLKNISAFFACVPFVGKAFEAPDYVGSTQMYIPYSDAFENVEFEYEELPPTHFISKEISDKQLGLIKQRIEAAEQKLMTKLARDRFS